MLVITLKENQALIIGDTEIFFRFDVRGSSRGRQVRAYINAPKKISIKRTETFYPDLKKLK